MAAAAVFEFSSGATAHDPPDFVGAVWGWPEEHLPVLDANLAEWEVIPEEFFITERDVVQSNNRSFTYSGPILASSISFRWTATWNDETNRIYWMLERFDDWDMNHGEGFEGVVDADHSGGTFWDVEGMNDDEIARQRGRHAQNYGWAFDEGCTEKWNNFWMTGADWYDDPAYTDQAHRVDGVPCGNGEATRYAEWYQIYWDDFNWMDPAGSLVHDFEADEIIGLAGILYDEDSPGVDTLTDGEEICNCQSRWTLSPAIESFGDADFLADFVIMPVDETANYMTAVEDNSWGRIKASLVK